MTTSLRIELTSWLSLVNMYGGISEARAFEMTDALVPLVAVDRKLSKEFAESKTLTASQEAARNEVAQKIKAIVTKYLDQLPCTVLRPTPDASLALIFERDWTRSLNLVPVPEAVMDSLVGEYWLPHAPASSTEEQESEEEFIPHISGKGSINCAVAIPDGTGLREVSMKARLDLETMKVRSVGQPFLVRAYDPAELEGKNSVVLDFDPFTEPDPVTGERYTLFCFADDGGKLLDLDPVTMQASSEDLQVEELADLAERLVQFAN